MRNKSLFHDDDFHVRMEAVDGPEPPIVSDSPAIRAALRGQLAHLKAIESSVQRFASSAAQLAASSASALDVSALAGLLSQTELAQLGVADVFVQLGDFAENMQHQLTRLVVEPLREYQTAIAAAQKRTQSVRPALGPWP